MINVKKCLCGSDTDTELCCRAIVEGKKRATTAVQLMRSRFFAFATANIPYLISTLHPEQRSTGDEPQLNQTLKTTQWLSLTILDCTDGLEADKHGAVEFVAAFQQAGTVNLLHEHSRFLKQHQQWFYVDGDLHDPQIYMNSLGRNAHCWCGSAKKLKHCHN